MSLRKIVMILLVTFSFLAASVNEAVTAATWLVSYNSTVTQIKVFAVYNDRLYAGGHIGQTDGHLYTYDGSVWTDLNFAAAIGKNINMIESMQVFNSRLYIGTRIQDGTSYYATVYYYDGYTFTEDFSAPGTSHQSGIEDMTVHDGALFATVGISNGAVYQRMGDGYWSMLGVAFTGNEMPRSLASFQGSLYAGSGYVNAKVWRWNGNAWELNVNLTTQLGVNQNAVWSLAVDGEHLYAGTTGAMVTSILPVYDGSTWSASLSSITGNIRLATINGHVWACSGNGHYYLYDGSTWQDYGAVTFSYDFAEYQGNIYAAGGDGKVYSMGSPDGYTIRGKIIDPNGNAISNVQLSDGAGHAAVTDSTGNYILEHLPGGTYTITPTLAGYGFYPQSISYTLDANKENQNYSGTITVNVDISLYSNPTTPDERTPYENIINYFANGVYESSNGARKIGTVTFHTANSFSGQADVNWINSCHPSSNVSGFGTDGLIVNMCDNFGSYNYLSDDTHQRGGGYTLAHEWGHYYFSLYDEYLGEVSNNSIYSWPHSTDHPVANSIMNSQWNAVNGDNNWLNFSVDKNFNSETAQYRMYGASGWDTLARPVAADPRDGARVSYPVRLYYPDLSGYWPGNFSDARIDLPGTARSALRIIWETASGDPAAQLDGPSYTAQLSSIMGEDISYPDPILLLAFVQKELPLTNSGVQANVLLPNGTTEPITFTDDGLPPDALKGDGLYSAILGYEADGIYTIQVNFDNNANTAAFVSTAFQPSLGPDGQPVPFSEPILANENFSVSKTIQVTVSGVKVDDHPNSISQAEVISADNLSIPGKIDFAGDKDVFQFTTLKNGITYVRVTDLALGMNPHLRILGSDGITVLFETNFDPVYSKYTFIPLTGISPETLLYAEVTHASGGSSGGLYEIGVGPRLASDTHQNFLYVPFIER